MPLAELTSFRIGGPADLFVNGRRRSRTDACEGGGVSRGRAVLLSRGGHQFAGQRSRRCAGWWFSWARASRKFEFDDMKVVAGAAAQFGAMVQAVVERGLEGLEFGEGIPGTVGGGLVMNAGAFGGEIARVVTLVHGVTEAGEALALTKDDVKFAYRRTELPPHFVITRVDFELVRGDHGPPGCCSCRWSPGSWLPRPCTASCSCPGSGPGSW